MNREVVGAIARYAAMMALFGWLISIAGRADVWNLKGLPGRVWEGVLANPAAPFVWFAFFFLVMLALVWATFFFTRKL